MTQKEAIKRLYGITDEKLLMQIEDLRRNLMEVFDTNWSPLFVLDLLAYFMMHKKYIDLIDAIIDEKDKSIFGKRLEVFLNVLSIDDIVNMISEFTEIEPKKSRRR